MLVLVLAHALGFMVDETAMLPVPLFVIRKPLMQGCKESSNYSAVVTTQYHGSVRTPCRKCLLVSNASCSYHTAYSGFQFLIIIRFYSREDENAQAVRAKEAILRRL
jgi:hypothetical protein